MSNAESARQGVIAVPRSLAFACAAFVFLLALGGAWLLWSSGGRLQSDQSVIDWVDPVLVQAAELDRDVVDADRMLRLFLLQKKNSDSEAFETRRTDVERSLAELQKLAEGADESTRKDIEVYGGEITKWLSLTSDVFKAAKTAQVNEGTAAIMARLGSQDLIAAIRAAHEQLALTAQNARETFLKDGTVRDSTRTTFSMIAFLLSLGAGVITLWLAGMASRVVKPMTPSVDLGIVRSVLDQLTDGIAIFGEDGQLIVSNLPAARVVEKSDSQSGGMAIFESDGSPVPADISPLSRALAGHHVHERELFAERLDGTLVPVEVRAEPVLESGHTTAAVIVIRDKGEEQRFESDLGAANARAATAEANLAELARRLKGVERELEDSRSGISKLEAEIEARNERLARFVGNVGAVGMALFRANDLRLQEINEAGLALLGERRRARDVRGSTIQDIVPGAEETGLADLFRKVAASGETYSSLEYYSQGLRQGAAYWRFSLVPLSLRKGGAVEEVALIGVDITNEVEQRALASQPKQIKPTFSIEEVLLAISNDLRTPILSIQGMVDLFRQKYAEAVPDVTALHYLELTQRNADQIATLIEDLVELSNLSKKELSIIELPLAAVIEEAWRAELRSGIELKVAGPLPTVRADRASLLRALKDIFHTAMRYRRDGTGASINVQVRDLGQRWEIEIADNGKGFPPNEAEQLFGPLATSLVPATNGSLTVVGSGIGLAAARRIAEMHGGTASASSVSGEGSTFTITLDK